MLTAHADLTLHALDASAPDVETRRRWAALQMAAAMRSGGTTLSRAQLRALGESALPLGTLQLARARQLAQARARGRCGLSCPHCGEVLAFDLPGLMVSTDGSIPELLDAQGWPSPPGLSMSRSPGQRVQGPPCATAAHLSLPVSGSVAVLTGPIDAVREGLAWARWESGPTGERRQFAQPGFRAILRCAVALESLDGEVGPEPPALEALPAADVLFIDACYHLLVTTTIPKGRGAVICQACSRSFLTALPTS